MPRVASCLELVLLGSTPFRRPWAEKYAADQAAFFADYAGEFFKNGMLKLSRHPPYTPACS